MLNTPDPTKWVVAHLPNADKLALGTSPYDSVPALLADARLASVGELIRRFQVSPVRDAAAFSALCDRVRVENADLMRHITALAAEVSRLTGAVQAALPKARPLSEAATADIAEQVRNLVFPGFLGATPYPQLTELPRYLQAAQTRLETLRSSAARDAPGLDVISRVEQAYAELCDISARGSVARICRGHWLVDRRTASGSVRTVLADPRAGLGEARSRRHRCRTVAGQESVRRQPGKVGESVGTSGDGRLDVMLDPRLLYTLDEGVAAKLKEHRPVLIHQMDGFVDAGQAGRLFSAHLLEQLDHEVLAEFDHDQLHDYRSRRPAMVFDTNRWKSYADLHLRVYRVVDEQGEVFLLFSGPEPDVQWERLATALIGLIEQFGVRLTVSVHGIPMAVPHTRPVTLTAHATDTTLVRGYRSWIDRVEVPASFAGLLEFRLGQTRTQGDGLRRACPALFGPGRVPRGHPHVDSVAEPGHWARGAARTAGEGVGQQPGRHR